LVTESPDFSPTGRTAPQLVPTLPTTEFIRAIDLKHNFTLPKFEAKVLSEDGDDDLTTVLLIDYGKAGADESPWIYAQPGAPMAPKTLADGPRDIGIPWKPSAYIPLGCHTVTMLVTHETKKEPPEYWCPADDNDFATLTWFVTLCEDIDSCVYSDCAITGTGEYQYCGSADPQE